MADDSAPSFIPAADGRLQSLHSRQNGEKSAFTSDLSVNELVLVKHAGYEPLGQVMGTSIFRIGWQGQPAWNAGEYTVITEAHSQARRLALNRLLEEAVQLQATGVVGVRISRKDHDWGRGLIEFSAIGTAIREINSSTASATPFLSTLSGEEFWTLSQSGFRPVGIAFGNSTYYRSTSTYNLPIPANGDLMDPLAYNFELKEHTQSFYHARELAMQRMMADAQSVNAHGIVDVELEFDATSHGEGSRGGPMLFHFTAIGTAVAMQSYVPSGPTVDWALSLGETPSLLKGEII